MNHTENEKNATKTYFRTGTILIICGLVFLIIDFLTNFENQWIRETSVMIYLITFGGELALNLAVSLRKQWEKDIAHIPKLTVNEQSIFNVRRTMFDSKPHFLDIIYFIA